MNGIKPTMMQMPLSVNSILEHAGSVFPYSEIVSRLPDKKLRRHTFADLYRRARLLASALQGLGLQKGDRVATLCWNHHAHLESYFGIPAAGGVMHTLNLRLSPDELGWIADHAQDRFLIVDDILYPLYRKFAKTHAFERVIVFPFSGESLDALRKTAAAEDEQIEDYEELLSSAPAGFEYAEHGEDDAVAMCYTSGTTGRPKGVVYSHRSSVIHSLTGALPDYMNISSRDVIMPITPMFHANAWGVPYTAVMLGAKLVFPGPHLHDEDLLDLMQEEPPTFSLAVTTIWMSLLQAYEAHPGRWKMPRGLRCQVGGVAVPEPMIRRYADLGVALDQGWGMTETSPFAVRFFRKPELKDLTEDEWFKKKALAGVKTPMIEARIVGDDGVCAWNGRDVGELQVRGVCVTGSYYREPVSESQFTADGWLRTGDVAAIDQNGYIRITDRTKDLIKSGGEWISSVDLEKAIQEHPSVVEASVIAVKHPKWDERPLVCVVLKPGATLDLAELRSFLAPKFASWQLPDALELMNEIPRTSTGKHWKARLRERYRDWAWPA